MLRSGFILGVGGPAAILTLLVLPSVRASADAAIAQDVRPAAVNRSVVQDLPGQRSALLPTSPLHLANAPRPEPKAAPAPSRPELVQETPARPKRMTREGCETAISSLAGPEARRMVPGRCMA